jgi:hypothetical protein
MPRAITWLRTITRHQFHHLVDTLSGNISHFSLPHRLELLLVVLLHFGFLLGKYTSLAEGEDWGHSGFYCGDPSN